MAEAVKELDLTNQDVVMAIVKENEELKNLVSEYEDDITCLKTNYVNFLEKLRNM